MRIDAWYSGLPEEALWEIYGKAKRLPWQTVAEWAAKQYDLPAAPKRSAYYKFRAEMAEREHADLIAAAARAKAHASELARRYGGDAQTADALRAYGSAVLQDTGDPGAAESFFRIADKLSESADRTARRRLAKEERARALKVAEDRLALDRAKFEAAEKRLAAAEGTVRDESLTPEQQVARMKEIFGIHA